MGEIKIEWDQGRRRRWQSQLNICKGRGSEIGRRRGRGGDRKTDNEQAAAEEWEERRSS